MNSERWDVNANTFVRDAKADEFIEAILAVCQEHDMALGHEDSHGAFIVYRAGPTEEDKDWLRHAHVST